MMTSIAPYLGVLSIVSTLFDIYNVCICTGFFTIAAVVLDIITAVLAYILSCPRQSKNNIGTNTYFNFDLNAVAPLPAQFKRVEVTESPGTIGKTVQQFTHGDPDDPTGNDYPLWSLSQGPNTYFSAKQRFAPWAYGLPKLTTVYDAGGNKIKETQNVYDFSYASETIAQGQPCLSSHCLGAPPLNSCKCQVLRSYSLRSDQWSDPTRYDQPTSYIATTNADMGVDIYPLYTGRVQLKTTYQRTYRTTDATQYVQNETDYFYNGPQYISPTCTGVGNNCTLSNYDPNLIVTYQSNGDVNYKSIKYSSDYNTGILATMVNANMLSVPVSTLTYVHKNSSGATQYLSEKVTEFTQLTNGDIKPSRILEQRFATPASSITLYSGPTTTVYTPYKIPQVFTYDANGNLTGLMDEGNRSITNIYDYNDKYITASVINADPVVDKPAYSSFESSDLSRSGWTAVGTSLIADISPAPTGNNGFGLSPSSANSLVANLNSAKAYTLSFWANNINVSVVPNVSGASLVKSAPVILGYTYYEYSIPSGNSSVTVKNTTTTQNLFVDELRLYPANARMRTTTYDPLIGKTSECDENNRIIYYAYDNLGRLQFIKDESGNIVKMYEYNNVSASKQVGCPVSYGNNLISEKFIRFNCGAGYQGDTAVYSIPANKYTSLISQQDADFKAELDLITNGPALANSTAGCAWIYYNTVRSKVDTTQTCVNGQVGGAVTYTVPANTYSSIISQADADQKAIDDISANAQAYANLPYNAVCSISTAPDWEWNAGDTTNMPTDPYYCLSVNGALPPHQFVLAKDLNPNSPTYNQTKYIDYGPSSACPANTYFNAQQSQTFTKNCGTGYIGSAVVYTVAPGTYSSTTSQAAADQLATNVILSNGQNYANANGTCTLSCTFSPYSGFGITTSGMNSSGTTVSFNIVFYPTGGQINVGSTYQIATVNGGCHPSFTRTVNVSSSGRTWVVTFFPGGQVNAYLQSGTALPKNSATSLSGSYSL